MRKLLALKSQKATSHNQFKKGPIPFAQPSQKQASVDSSAGVREGVETGKEKGSLFFFKEGRNNKAN